MIEQQVIFRGRVQGVGFRATVVSLAQKYHLKGSVTNLPDGTVKAVLQGEKKEIEAFHNALKSERGAHRIDDVVIEEKNLSQNYSGFKVG